MTFFNGRNVLLRKKIDLRSLPETRKPRYRKDDRAMRPIYGSSEKNSGVPDGYFSQSIVNKLLL